MLRKGIVLHNELLLWCQGRRSIQSLRWYWMAQAENRCMPPGPAKLETVLLLYHGSISHICNMPRLLQFYVCQLGEVRPQFSFSLWSLIKRCFTLTDRMLMAQSPSTTAIIIWSIKNTVVPVILSKHCLVYISVKCRASSDQTVRMLETVATVELAKTRVWWNGSIQAGGFERCSTATASPLPWPPSCYSACFMRKFRE